MHPDSWTHPTSTLPASQATATHLVPLTSSLLSLSRPNLLNPLWSFSF